MDTLKKFFELTEKALAVLTKVSFLMGGAILLIYCVRYGGFPDGLTIGDTLRIFLTVTVFSIGTLVTYFFLMCLGVSVWYALFRLSRLERTSRGLSRLEALIREARRRKTVLRYGHSEFCRNYKRKRPILYHYRFPSFTPMFYLMSVLTILGMLTMVREDQALWYIKLICAALYLGAWYILIDLNRQRGAQMDLIFRDQQIPVKLRSEIRLVNTICTAFIFISVTFYLGLFDATANQTMRLLGIRHDHAIVYLQETWSNVLAEHGIIGTKTNYKPYAARYEDVTVAISSFGSSVALEFYSNGKTQMLRVPAAAILIDPLPRSEEDKNGGPNKEN
ncbi:hypothetical protein [Pantoea agglomerans]|uniref:hypothetical protein n=1 Tax=Enterobacter agglomerans TaxID=549 RepID=UPI0032096FAC